jgi:hypothetical protein
MIKKAFSAVLAAPKRAKIKKTTGNQRFIFDFRKVLAELMKKHFIKQQKCPLSL